MAYRLLPETRRAFIDGACELLADNPDATPRQCLDTWAESQGWRRLKWRALTENQRTRMALDVGRAMKGRTGSA